MVDITDIFPKPPAATSLSVARILPEEEGDNQRDFWVWLRSLQGLVNTGTPSLYIIPPEDRFSQEHWISYYRDRFDVSTKDIGGAAAILEAYRDQVDGYVVYDPEVLQTANLATTRAGLERILPIAPDQEHWMKSAGIPRRDDLRGKFRNDWDAAEWAYDNLRQHCHPRLYANLCIHRPHWSSMLHFLEDYIVANKVFALDLPASKMFRKPLGLYRKIMQSIEAPGAQFGWHCTFDQEKEYVEEAAEYGVMTIASTSILNLSVHGSVGDREKGFTQPLPPAETCRAEKGKVYVCFYVSDGDACSAVNGLQSQNWVDPDRGSCKVGWGILPLAATLTPAMVQYYHETRTDADCLWGPSSGAAYTYTNSWPEDLMEWYLAETRRMLDQTGQNGCNMVNWFLRDWWREVENEEVVEREKRMLQPGPGMVCGLGGSLYARSYPGGSMPKIHSVHIANARRDNTTDIVKFSEECPTRPLFMFLFAQEARGILGQLKKDCDKLAEYENIEVLSMDEFALTLKDASDRGLVGEELYESNDALAEKWLKRPGRHRLPIAEYLTRELVEMAHDEPEARRKKLAEAAWSELVSREMENIGADRNRFLKNFEGRTPFMAEEEADALLYIALYTAWGVTRAVVESQGIYANNRHKTLEDFVRVCGDKIDVTPFQKLFAAWDCWENGVPAFEETRKWAEGVAAATRTLRDVFGPNESEEAFTNWPPRSI